MIIESLDDPRLDIFRSLKKTNQNRNQDVFIAEGVTVVERLFESDFEVQSVVVTDQKMEAFRQKIPSDVAVYSLTRELASELVGYKFHMGVLAAASRRRSVSIATALPASGPSLVFIADKVIDQQNVGLLIRIASAFGADALILTEGSADPFSRRAIRVSTGNGFFLPIVDSVLADNECLSELKHSGYSLCATVLSEDAEELNTFAFPERTVIAFGNETHGISQSLLAQCDRRLTVSMLNGTDSVNIAIAAGIFGYAYRATHR